MQKGIFYTPNVSNEKIKEYRPNSEERELLEKTYDKMYSKKVNIPQYIGDNKVFSKNKQNINPPHEHGKNLGCFNKGNEKDVFNAINYALKIKNDWAKLSWENRASIFLKAAELISGPYRYKINAATMIGQSKNVFQAEIDSACELVDFMRFNVKYMEHIYKNQPLSSSSTWNRIEYRPLEGFLVAITPFNFTAIAGNLPCCMAMMGNVVIWKPSYKQLYSAQIIMEVLEKSGLPNGVINMLLVDGNTLGEVVFNHPDFSGIHFTGSDKVFKEIWKKIGNNISKYKTYPRIVGETGGKDFIWSHVSASSKEVSSALSRGAFEYQGQKCSAVSRAYLPISKWNKIKKYLLDDINSMKIGDPRNFSNFINSVIDKISFDKIKGYIDRVKNNLDKANIVIGGNYDDSIGYFISPTVICCADPYYESMIDEIFGPVLSIYLYNEKNWIENLNLVNNTSNYALTGAVFSKNRYIIEKSSNILENAAGNFYINDKPTGAVVGQQPFGGSRHSGTNDKAGSMINLLRWVSARTIKENFFPTKGYKYPFMENN